MLGTPQQIVSIVGVLQGFFNYIWSWKKEKKLFLALLSFSQIHSRWLHICLHARSAFCFCRPTAISDHVQAKEMEKQSKTLPSLCNSPLLHGRIVFYVNHENDDEKGWKCWNGCESLKTAGRPFFRDGCQFSGEPSQLPPHIWGGWVWACGGKCLKWHIAIH